MRALAIAAALLAGCATVSGRKYDNGDLALLTAYKAKEMCSCIFVMEQPEDWCRAWTRASPDLASVEVDRARGVVESSALLFWGARARFAGEKFGCVLEP